MRTCLGALGVVLASAGCSGCTVDTVCNNPSLLWLWLVLPMLLGAVGGFVGYLMRLHQLKGWNLSTSPRAPKLQSVLIGTTIFAVILFISFPSFMIPAEACEPDQKAANIHFWLIGSLLGTIITLGGLWLAKQNYSKGSESW